MIPIYCTSAVIKFSKERCGYMEFKIGSSFKTERSVEEKDTALAFGSGSIRVLATPAMVSLMEYASSKAIEPYLEEGYTTVGTGLDIRHLAATPVGMKVIAKAELVKVEGRKLTFNVEVYDESEKVGEGVHQRYIVNAQRFTEKAYKKGPAK